MTGPTHALHKIIRQYSPRAYAFYDVGSGQLAARGRTIQASPNVDIVRLLEWSRTVTSGERPRTIYITGGATVSDIPGYSPKNDDAIDFHWTKPVTDGWSITSWHRDPWRVSYEKAGCTVDVAMAATWYGSERSAKKCYEAHTLLSAMLRHTFDGHAVLMGTPGRTGADLLQRSLPQGAEYEQLAEPILHVLEHNFGQGRIESNDLYAAPGATIPGVWVLDARWQYASCLRHLPIGPAKWDKRHPEYHGYRKAVYRISTRVPDDWSHIGLAPTWSPADERYVWPHRPGKYIDDAWLTGAELTVLYENAWPVNIRESIVYANEDAPGNDPARRWIEKLRELRAWAELNHDELVMRAIRAMTIYAVGYMHRRSTFDVRFVPYGQESTIPREALQVLPLPAGIRYTIQQRLDPATAPLYRPEWAIQVWGSARAKLNIQALTYPAERVLWLRHDSIVLDYDPAPVDDGKIGSWRIKKWHAGECKPPLTEAAYRELMKESD